MKNSKKRQEDLAVKTFFETVKLETHFHLLWKQQLKEQEEQDRKEDYKLFAPWKVFLVWILKLTCGGGFV